MLDDISKDVFDVHGSIDGHSQYSNDESGFKKFLKEVSKNSLVAMEATGYYHYRLAQFLYKNGVVVTVINPLSIKRFIHLSPTSALSRKRNERKTPYQSKDG